MARPKPDGSNPGRASSDSLATASNPVMKYGTICATSSTERKAPAVPGRANSGGSCAGAPRAKPSVTNTAKQAHRPSVVAHYSQQLGRMPREVTAATPDVG